MEFEESIYNLIPKEQYKAEKPKRYKSQYPPNLAPTASTFGLGTTSKPQCSNLAGKFNLEGGSHSHLAGGATMGTAKGALKPDTTGFRKKGTGQPVLIPKSEGKYQLRLRNSLIVTHDEFRAVSAKHSNQHVMWVDLNQLAESRLNCNDYSCFQ